MAVYIILNSHGDSVPEKTDRVLRTEGYYSRVNPGIGLNLSLTSWNFQNEYFRNVTLVQYHKFYFITSLSDNMINKVLL